MVFHPEGQFQQFPHCKFRENVVRLLYIPSILQKPKDDPLSTNFVFLAVNKFGKVGLYHPEKFSLLHTYCLDLSVPMHPHAFNNKSSQKDPPPKCERTHLITDAVFSGDLLCVIFSTTKSLLQWYDIGEIQYQDIGLELFPRNEFLELKHAAIPVMTVHNRGHVECHRLFDLSNIPSCLEYWKGRLLIGDVEGGITIISIPDAKAPLGRRKIRGKLHHLLLSELARGTVHFYKAHNSPVTDIHFLSERHLVLSTSKDKKFSVFVKDITDTVDNIIVSIPKGVNALAYSPSLKMVATGSDDYVVRLFNQFVMKMPQMELFGHRSSVLSVAFVEVDPSLVPEGDNPILLLSYSTDSELRAWDPMTFICLQNLYLTFPIGSTIMCKTPEFAKKSLLIFIRPIPSDYDSESMEDNADKKATGRKKRAKETGKLRRDGNNGTVILLYCNSYARIPLEKETSSRWPLDYDEFIQEFEELSIEYDKKLKEKLNGRPGRPVKSGSVPKTVKKMTSFEEVEDPILKEESDDKVPEKLESEENIFLPKARAHGGGDAPLSKGEFTKMIDSKLDKYIKEVLELRQSCKESAARPTGRPPTLLAGRRSKSESIPNTARFSASSTVDDTMSPDLSPPAAERFNISVEATNKYFEFKRAKGKNLPNNLRRRLCYGQVFNQYPLLDVDPVEFSQRKLPIPENMKTVMGVESINSVQQLFTPEAQNYFRYFQQPHQNTASGVTSATLTPASRIYHALREKETKKDPPPRSRFAVFGKKIHNIYEDDLPPLPVDDHNYD